MKEKTKRLRELQEQRKMLREMGRKIERKKHLQKVIPEMEKQLAELTRNLREYRLIMKLEQWEANRLERISLTTLYCMLLGIREQELEREKREAAQAYMKFSTAEKEKENIQKQLEECKQELKTLENCEAEYEHMVAERLRELREEDSQQTQVLLKLEEKEQRYENQLKELDEALAAARSALRAANAILERLNEAENLGKGEKFGDGFFGDLMKHQKLDEVQWEIVCLQNGIRKMKTELLDVDVAGDVSLKVDRELRFADVFFDDLWYTGVVQVRMGKTKEQTVAVRKELVGVVERLQTMRDHVQRKLEKQRQKIRTFAAE